MNIPLRLQQSWAVAPSSASGVPVDAGRDDGCRALSLGYLLVMSMAVSCLHTGLSY